MKLPITILLFILICPFVKADKAAYESAYLTLEAMLEGKETIDFKKAIFTVENAYYGNTMSYEEFDKGIKNLAHVCKGMIAKKQIQEYKTAGNWAIFMLMTQKIPENDSLPYGYDFEDFLGRKDYSNRFVTRTLRDKKGTCLSLPMFYKCIAQDLKVEANLTIGPSHLWITHLDEEGNSVNVELTSGQLPSDGLMMTELGITRASVKSGAYFNPLTEKESIAFLLTELGFSYARKYGEYDDFTEKCADLSLEHMSANILAYHLKSNKLATEAMMYVDRNIDNSAFFKMIHNEYLAIQNKLKALGDSDIDTEDYNEWVNSMKARKQNE